MIRHLLALLCCLLLSSGPLRAGDDPIPRTRAGVMDHVFMTAQRAGITAASQALAQSATRIAAGRADLAALLRERQDSAAQLANLSDAQARAAARSGSASEAEQARLAALMEKTRAAVERLDQRLDSEFPAFRQLTDPAPLSIAEVQATLDPDEALLFTLSDTEATFVWAISKTTADWHRAESGLEIRRTQVKALRQQLSGGDALRAGIALKPVAGTRPGLRFDRTAAHAIYADLFQPLEHVFGKATHVMVVLDGPLTSLPLALLVTRPPEGRDDDPSTLRATPWMLRKFALTTLPNVSALKVLRFARGHPAQQDAARQPFVGFGDPQLGYRLISSAESEDNTIVTRGVYADLTRVADLAPLPNTARELRRLAATMGAGPDALFLGRDATETQVKHADLHNTDVVAFATHGLLADGLPGLVEPALVFTPPATPTAEDDALLTASEAAQLNLSADLVILSACNTAGSDGTPGAEGLSGLARAFLYAGARAILVSHWPVDDYAASALTTEMLDTIRQGGAPRAIALRHAMLALMDDTSEDRFAHPRLWAPFVVVGEGGRDG